MRVLTVGTAGLLLEVDRGVQVIALSRRLPAELRQRDVLLVAMVPGARTLLLSFESAEEAAAARAVLGAVVPALLGTAPGADAGAGSGSAGAPSSPGPASPERPVEIPVEYDGEDLASIAMLTELSPERVVAAHSGVTWTAAFAGFAPGFAYLVPELESVEPGLREDVGRLLEVPRLSSPRTRVPAGAVAVAGGFSAVYPQASPGGWQLIGRTDAPLWDASRLDPLGEPAPALLQAGSRVRFVPAGSERAQKTMRPKSNKPDPAGHGAPESGTGASPELSRTPATAAASIPARDAEPVSGFTVERPGPLTLLQDAGRPGREGWGVSPSGALDPEAMRTINTALGNTPGAPVLEAVGGGLTLLARGHHTVALAGAADAVVSGPDGERTLERNAGDVRLGVLFDGERLTLTAPTAGLRTWVAVRGGFRGALGPHGAGSAPVLGSWSTDQLSGLGPDPLKPGDVLCVSQGAWPRDHASGREHATGRTASAPTLAQPGLAQPDLLPRADGAAVTLHYVPGPRQDWVSTEDLDRLAEPIWRVAADSNRVALRLVCEDSGTNGIPLRRAPGFERAELPSEPLVTGAIQVPPSGNPILFLADRPVTGGYPVVGVVTARSLRLAAQLAPGAAVRFEAVEANRQEAPLEADKPSTGPAQETDVEPEPELQPAPDDVADARPDGSSTTPAITGETVAEVIDDVVRIGLTLDGAPVTLSVPLDVIRGLSASE